MALSLAAEFRLTLIEDDVRRQRPVYADGPFCPIHWARVEGRVCCYTYRGGVYARSKGDLVAPPVTVYDDREFCHRYIETQYVRIVRHALP